MNTFSESINQLKTFVSELPSEYIATVLISLLIIIAITLIALIVGKKMSILINYKKITKKIKNGFYEKR